MALIHNLERRLTFSYNDSHSNLDKWEDSGVKVKVLNSAIESDPGNGYDVGPTTHCKIVRVKPKGHLNKDEERDFIQLIYRNFEYSGCSHEHDCCGCPSRRVSIKKLKGRGGKEYRMTFHITFNY